MSKIAIRVALLAILLAAVVVAGWAVACRDTGPVEATTEPTPVYPLFRAQGYGDETPAVVFPVARGRLLVLVIEPVSGTVSLPSGQGTWLAARTMALSDTLTIHPKDAEPIPVISPGDWQR